MSNLQEEAKEYALENSNKTSPRNKISKMKSKYDEKSMIRIDSPKTQEACKIAGYEITYFDQKTIDDFKKPGVNEEIAKLNYNH